MCPWSILPPAVIDFCESNRCAWVVEPINSLSCLAFVLGGIYIWHLSKRDGAKGMLKATGPISAFIGVFSVALHATMTQFGQFLDLASMYLFGTILLFFNYRRMRTALKGPAHEKHDIILYLGANAFIWLLHALWPASGVPAFCIMVTTTFILEIILWRIQRRKVQYRWLWATVALFGVSMAIWIADIRLWWCNPTSWLQGHALWHCGCAASTVTAYKHFRQFARYGEV